MEKPLPKIIIALLIAIFIANYSDTLTVIVFLISLLLFIYGLVMLFIYLYQKRQNVRLPSIILIISFALFVVSLSSGVIHSSEDSPYIQQIIKGKNKKTAQQNKTYKSDGYEKVPNTFLMKKEDVEKEITDLGLKVRFFDANLQSEADKKRILIPEGTCNKAETDNTKYFTEKDTPDGESGYYAKKGATIIVGYATKDYDGR
ncbi:hypothetical protein BG261_03510 [Floricoccus tropicus]|uniref:Uncharacterized protein n=1 Tax=Floricoccus tropicus TaxID=1859473 RepID=A0A1E8GN45_9LACT|nr:hypothetical protein [Floricoccus tropicus]OFI49662.1 hypothetical protein BG261_03510 [Floricoccus tropicus]